MTISALFSIHDVMPETLHEVEGLLEQFVRRHRPLPALLVVPDRDWTRDQVRRLHEWEQSGAELIAHGWRHQTTPRRIYHRLHSLLISRNVAEHLALDTSGVRALMRRSRAWFGEQGLALPETYIPPAWALGMSPRELTRLPYRRVETLRGVQLVNNGAVDFRSLPLLGFEADSPLRALFLRQFNRRQLRRAIRDQVPLRISIHPHDANFRLKNDLFDTLEGDFQDLRYQQLAC